MNFAERCLTWIRDILHDPKYVQSMNAPLVKNDNLSIESQLDNPNRVVFIEFNPHRAEMRVKDIETGGNGFLLPEYIDLELKRDKYV